MAAYYKNVGNTVRVIESAPEVKEKPAVKVKKRSAVMFVYRNDHKHKVSVLTVITLMMIFAGAAGTAAAFANVSVAKHQIIVLNNDLLEKRSQINNMAEEAKRYGDVGSIIETARDRLGMSEPKPYQIVHINVPDENYVEYNQQN